MALNEPSGQSIPELLGINYDEYTITTATPTPSGAWEPSQTYLSAQASDTTSLAGYNCRARIVVDSSGNPTFTLTAKTGYKYKPNDTITFTEPGNTANTAVITISTAKIVIEGSSFVNFPSFEPTEDSYVFWVDTEGDFKIIINKNGTIKTATIVDFSEI